MSSGSTSAPAGRGSDSGSIWLPTIQVGLAVVVVGALLARQGGGVGFVVFFLCGVAAVLSLWAGLKAFGALRDPTLERPVTAEDARAAMEYEKRLALLGLRELEADIAAGKVDEADAAHLKQTAEDKALRLIHQIREEDSYWREQAEALVKGRSPSPLPPPAPFAPSDPAADAIPPGAVALAPAADPRLFDERAYAGLFDPRPAPRTALGEGMVCGGCQGPIEAAHRFCAACGRPLEAA